MKILLQISIILCLVSGCVAPPMVNKKTIADLSTNTGAGVALQYGPNIVCHHMSLTIKNLQTGETHEAEMYYNQDYRHDAEVGSKVDLLSLPEGRYQFVKGKCQSTRKVELHGGFVHSFSDMQRWFEPFEVEAGRITYPGSINLNWQSFKTGSMLPRIPEWLMKAPRDRYMTYSNTDNFEYVQAQILKTVPTADIRIDRAEITLDTEIYMSIIRKAYQTIDEETEGSYPDSRQARLLAGAWLRLYQQQKTFDPEGPVERLIKKAVFENNKIALIGFSPLSRVFTVNHRTPVSSPQQQTHKPPKTSAPPKRTYQKPENTYTPKRTKPNAPYRRNER